MKNYIKNAYDVAKCRKISGFDAFEKSGNKYIIWPNCEKTNWNSIYVEKINEQNFSEIKEISKKCEIGIISQTKEIDDSISKYVKHEDTFNILNSKRKSHIEYKSTLILKKVENIEDFKKWIEAASKIYGSDADFVFNAFKNDLEIKCGHYFFGYEGDKIVAVSQTITNNEVAGVYWVGVDEKYRQKGYGYDITAFAINSMIGMNIYNFTLSASKMGEKIYKSMGFIEGEKLYKFTLK